MTLVQDSKNNPLDNTQQIKVIPLTQVHDKHHEQVVKFHVIRCKVMLGVFMKINPSVTEALLVPFRHWRDLPRVFARSLCTNTAVVSTDPPELQRHHWLLELGFCS